MCTFLTVCVKIDFQLHVYPTQNPAGSQGCQEPVNMTGLGHQSEGF